MSSFTLANFFFILLIVSTVYCIPSPSQPLQFSSLNLYNSTFTSRSLSFGDLYGFDGKCASKNTSFLQIVSSSNQISLSSYWSDDKILLNNCYQVKDDYHLCHFTSSSTSSSGATVCIRLDDDIEDDNELELAINFDIESCTSFDFEPKCRLDSGSVIGMVTLIKYPGDNSTRMRNYAIATVVILIILCVCCLLSCGMVMYCCLMKKRRDKLTRPFDSNEIGTVEELRDQDD